MINNDKLLVMHRNKFGAEYDTLPGGAIDMGETAEQALVREIAEETSVTISSPRLVFLEHAGDMYGDQYIFLCDYVSGEPKLSPQSEESKINRLGKNLYKPDWVKLSDLPELPFVSERLKESILRCLKADWPDAPVEF